MEGMISCTFLFYAAMSGTKKKEEEEEGEEEEKKKTAISNFFVRTYKRFLFTPLCLNRIFRHFGPFAKT